VTKVAALPITNSNVSFLKRFARFSHWIPENDYPIIYKINDCLPAFVSMFHSILEQHRTVIGPRINI
jgi:hypothetical protein